MARAFSDTVATQGSLASDGGVADLCVGVTALEDFDCFELLREARAESVTRDGTGGSDAGGRRSIRALVEAVVLMNDGRRGPCWLADSRESAAGGATGGDRTPVTARCVWKAG